MERRGSASANVRIVMSEGIVSGRDQPLRLRDAIFDAKEIGFEKREPAVLSGRSIIPAGRIGRPRNVLQYLPRHAWQLGDGGWDTPRAGALDTADPVAVLALPLRLTSIPCECDCFGKRHGYACLC
jgi:hypothetical protein